MSTSTSSDISAGVGLPGFLFLLLVGLKLTGFIAWSWWWVTAPLWGPPAFALGIGVPVFVVLILVAMFFKRGPFYTRGAR